MRQPEDTSNAIERAIERLLGSLGLQDQPLLETLVAALALLVVAFVAHFITERILVRVVRRVTEKTLTSWDDELMRAHVFSRLANIVPAAIIYYGVLVIPHLPGTVDTVVQALAGATVALVLLLAFNSTLEVVSVIYERYSIARSRPIKGYLQVAKLVAYIVAAVVIISTLVNRSPLLLLSGLGAMTAVLMLVFKDTILSLVASIQITNTDMIRVGDWIEVPQHGADGDVIDISLYTVRVQNWDKTITAIPTHKFLTEAFKNWRSMPASGGRRIKRSLFIDESTIRFLSDAEVERFKEFALLKDYIARKEDEVREYNAALEGDADANVNARRLTNVGTFRAYVFNYLQHHQQINQDLTLLVRQRDPTPDGLPLEIYAFTSDTAWAAYEGIQSDVFDHVIAIVPEFGLRLYQSPSSADVRSVGLELVRAGTAPEEQGDR